MTIGTLYFTHIIRSCSSRLFDMCTIWFTAKGAAGRSGFFALCEASSSVISASHSSSWASGRAFRAGNCANNAGLALRERQLRMRYDEEGRGDDGKPQIVFQDRRQGHHFTSQEVYVYANVKYQIRNGEERRDAPMARSICGIVHSAHRANYDVRLILCYCAAYGVSGLVLQKSSVYRI